MIAQAPDRGTLFRGETVELTASKGPVMVEVPKVRASASRRPPPGWRPPASRCTERSEVYVGLEFVVKSDPAQGSMAPRGSTVTLFLV